MNYVSPSQMVGSAILGTLLLVAALGVLVATIFFISSVLLAVGFSIVAVVLAVVGLVALAMAGSAAGALEDAQDRPYDEEVQTALQAAALDLRDAADTFAAMRESQEAGHHPEVGENVETYALKAAAARDALARLRTTASPAPMTDRASGCEEDAGAPSQSRAGGDQPPEFVVEMANDPYWGRHAHMPGVLAQAFGISSSEGRRVLVQGGVRLDARTLYADNLDLPASELHGRTLTLGKRRAVRLTTSPAPAAGTAAASFTGGVGQGGDQAPVGVSAAALPSARAGDEGLPPRDAAPAGAGETAPPPKFDDLAEADR